MPRHRLCSPESLKPLARSPESMTPASFELIRVRAGGILDGIGAGDSIAVNGVCLTVRTFAAGTFTADLSRETLDRTSLKDLRAGVIVNLERPMRADGRFGGHIVQGHVDGVGRIRNFDRVGDNWNLRGGVSGNGIALHRREGFHRHRWDQPDSSRHQGVRARSCDYSAYVREYKLAACPKTGDSVNLEFDVIAKYVERMMNQKLSYEIRND